MKIEQNNKFVNENRDKLESYVDDIEIIGRSIPTKEFRELYNKIEKDNPKITKIWDVISTGIMYGQLVEGKEWYNFANWHAIITELGTEMDDFINQFKSVYPIYFETIKF